MLWGWREGTPRGGCLVPLRDGVWIQALSVPRPATHVMCVGAQHCSPVFHAPRGAACHWGGGGLSRGGGLPPLWGPSGVRRCPSPGRSPFEGWAARVPRTVCPWCGWCGLWEPGSLSPL